MTLNLDISGEEMTLTGYVKWFDVVKGFGFITVDNEGTDVLLSANVLRNFGQSSVIEGSFVEFRARVTQRGMQAVTLITLTPPEMQQNIVDDDVPSKAPLVPARVKWFDLSKGFGFANEFGNRQDIFLHIDILRKCGLANLQESEAISIRITERDDGLLASEIHAWSYALNHS